MSKYLVIISFILLGTLQINIVQAEGNKAEMEQDMVKCRLISEISIRVSCYDKIADELNQRNQASQKAGQQILTPQQPERSFRQKFMETFGLKKSRETKPEEEAVILEVKKFQNSLYNKFILTTTNGQVWRQVDSERRRFPTKTPFEITITRGTVGGYFLHVQGKGGRYRVKRTK